MMKPFLDKNFFLNNKTAEKLYHEYAADMPIYDYHCHLNPHQILEDKCFENLGEAWLDGDHYKWRAMRANGVEEAYITGTKATWEEKFYKWAETAPATLRNPLYHWTHLELQRYFGIDELLSPKTAKSIFEKASGMLQSDSYSTRNLLKKMNVAMVYTSDDPLDDLLVHQRISELGDFDITVKPTFRPDKAINLSSRTAWKLYIKKLEELSCMEIYSMASLVEALDMRHCYFHDKGCRLADHGVTYLMPVEMTPEELDQVFVKAFTEQPITAYERCQFEAAMLFELAQINHKRGWVQQFHVGAFRDTNKYMMQVFGADAGCDSIADYQQGPGLVSLLGGLAGAKALTKTILYNLNPADNELFASMVGNYQGGGEPGKIQWGAAWWFLDQQDGIRDQVNALSRFGLLSCFVGMLTDSRSFLSFPRHEYFRRILCNLIGTDIENGELPNDMELIGSLVKNVCYRNADRYF